MLSELQPQELKFDQEILIENSFDALKQQDEVIERLTYQSNFDKHCEAIFSRNEKQGEDQQDCGDHMEVPDEIEALNANCKVEKGSEIV
ncbi:hypothetical protein ACLOJK_019055 [Asimina triloba]